MKKKYSLDFSIERDIDRLHAVEDILDSLEKDPAPSELEQMASYILYGKDENGQNSKQRNETIDKDKRYKSYKTKDDKVQSLDEIMETPGFDEQKIRSAYKRDAYLQPKPRIDKPKYDKDGKMIDPGDSDVPGMIEQWEIIDRWQRMLDIAQGKLAANESDVLMSDSYRVYRIKHNLIDLRRHQYYLKDSYKPQIHFQNLDHPKPQFYDWSGDSFYWITREQWQDRVDHAYTSTVSKNIEDYEVREDGMIKWIVCEHKFDWENPLHVRALLNNYYLLYEALRDKVNTYGCTLLWDLDRYIDMCDFSDLRLFIIQLRKLGLSHDVILEEVRARFNYSYSPNYLASVTSNEIPERIARAAKMHHIEVDTPRDQWKKCIHCGKEFPRHLLFFSRNSSRKDGFSSTCKWCDRVDRIKRGVVHDVDKRAKDPTLPQV